MIYLPQPHDVFFVVCAWFKPNLFGEERGTCGETVFVFVAAVGLLIVKHIRIIIMYLENKINYNNNNYLAQEDNFYFLE